MICFLSVVIYRNTLTQRQYVLYYIECPSEGGIVEGGIAEGGIVGCGISLQYHPLLWWAGLRKVREKYHIYTYQWNCRIIKEICIKYNIGYCHSLTFVYWLYARINIFQHLAFRVPFTSVNAKDTKSHIGRNISLGCIRWHKRITYVVYDWNQESGRSGFCVLRVLNSQFSMIFLLDWNCVVLYVFPYIGTCFVFWFHWIINILISAMKQWWHYHSSLSWNCSWTLCFFSSNTRQWALN